MVHSYNHKVQYFETDRMGVVHHSNYIRIMEEARVDFLESCGFGYDRMEAEGVGAPVIGVTADYKRSCTFGDTVRVDVSIVEVSAFRMRFGYAIFLNDKQIFYGTSLHCFIDSKVGRPVKFEERFPELYESLKPYFNL